MQKFKILWQKEFGSYFKNGLAWFVLAAYVVLSMVNTFYLGHYFEVQSNDMFSFFYLQPQIIIMIIPLLAMHSWSDEYKSGTAEILLTLPVSYLQMVLAKFLSIWAICGIMLLLTLPLTIYTGSIVALDSLKVFSAYFSCFLLMGAFGAVSCAISAFNKSPVAAYLIAVLSGWIMLLGSLEFMTSKLANGFMTKAVEQIGLTKQYYDGIGGQIGADNVLYFGLIIALSLWVNVVAVKYKRK